MDGNGGVGYCSIKSWEFQWISSSHATDSWCSEGWFNHQPDSNSFSNNGGFKMLYLWWVKLGQWIWYGVGSMVHIGTCWYYKGNQHLCFGKGPGSGGEHWPFQVFVVPPETHRKVTFSMAWDRGATSISHHEVWPPPDTPGSGHFDRHSSKFLGRSSRRCAHVPMFQHFAGRVSQNWRPCKPNFCNIGQCGKDVCPCMQQKHMGFDSFPTGWMYLTAKYIQVSDSLSLVRIPPFLI